MKAINRNIKSVRKSKGLNQTELAEAIGGDWTQRIVSRVEQGQELTVTQLEEVLRVLGPDVLAGSLLENLVSADFAYLVQQKRDESYLSHVLRALNATNDAERHMKILQRIVQGIPEDEAVQSVEREMPRERLPRLQRLMHDLDNYRVDANSSDVSHPPRDVLGLGEVTNPAEGTGDDAEAYLREQEGARRGVDQET